MFAGKSVLSKNDRDEKDHWVIVLGWLVMGGAERQALHLARYLRLLGENVTIIGIDYPGNVQDICAAESIPCFYWPVTLPSNPVRAAKRVLNFAWRLRQLRPTYILPYCMPPNILCGLSWRFTGAQTCVWQQRDEGRDRRHDWLESWAVRFTPKFISNSRHSALWLTQQLKVNPEQIRVIGNGISVASSKELKGQWKRKYGIDKNVQIVSMVAHLHHYKDHLTLLKAWICVIHQLPTYRLMLILAGQKDSTYHELKEFVDQNGISGSVMFTGNISNVEELLADTTLFVFSSNFEGVPNGILEAMAMGLPIVATDIPGNREALEQNTENQLAKAGNHTDMAEKIVHLLSQPKLMAELGRLNHKIVNSRNTIEGMVRATISVVKS